VIPFIFLAYNKGGSLIAVTTIVELTPVVASSIVSLSMESFLRQLKCWDGHLG
jgi:hypothetical protein